MISKQAIPGGRKTKAVLETIVRSRVVPLFIVHHLHFRDRTENAVSQCLRPLREQGWVQDTTIVGRHKAFMPARRAARFFGLPPSCAANPPAQQPLQQNLGATLYCALDRPKKRLLPSELFAEVPWLPKSLAQRPLYLDHENGKRRLAVIRVELIASAYRIVKKHTAQLYKLCEKSRRFRTLVDADEYMIVTIADSPAAAERIADEIGRAPAYPRAKVMAWPEQHLHLILGRR